MMKSLSIYNLQIFGLVLVAARTFVISVTSFSEIQSFDQGLNCVVNRDISANKNK